MVVTALLPAFGGAPPLLAQTNPLTPPPNRVGRPDPGLHAITGATAHVRPGQTVENATVVLHAGRIVRVEAGAAAPAGARVWDGAGLHVYAGLIDPYVEVEAPRPDAESKGAHWSDQVTPQRSALDGKGITESTARPLRELGFVAAGIAPRGPGVFRGQGAVVSLAQPDADMAVARPAAYRAGVFHTVAFDPAGDNREADGRWAGYPGSQMGCIALVRQTLSDAAWLATRRREPGAGAGAGAGSGQDPLAAAGALDALAPALGAPLLFTVEDELEVVRAAKIAREFNRPAIVMGSGTEFRRLEAITARLAGGPRADGAGGAAAGGGEQGAIPLVIPVNFPPKPKVASVGDAEAMNLGTLMTWEQAPTNPARLAAAGVPFALTTARLKDRGTFDDNVWAAVRHGLAEDEALAAVTTRPAEILGVADQLGALEAGKRASIVVCDGPLFAKKTKIRDVWIDGVRHEITPAPSALEGTFTLDVGRDDAVVWELVVKRGEVTVRRDADGPGEAKATQAKGRSVVLGEDRLTFVMDREAVEEGEGPVAVQVTLDRAATPPGVVGEAVGADGRRAAFTGVRQPAADAPKADAPDGAKPEADGAKAEDAKPEKPERAGDEEDEPKPDVPEKLPGLPFGAYARAGLPERPALVALTNATVWTSGPQGKIEGGMVVVRDGVIESVGPAGPVPAGARVVDCSGKHITPGLIDCHSHTGISRGVNEAGQAVTAEVRIGDVTDPDAMNWYRQLAGGITTVNSLHGSANAIGGQNQVNKVRWGVADADGMHFAGAASGIKFALGENVKQSNWGDRYTTRYPQTRMGVEAIIRDRFLAAREYMAAMEAHRAKRTLATEAGPRPDLELEALAEILRGERLVHCHSYRQDEILMLARLAAEFGFKLGTYQHILEGYKVADAVRDSAIGASAFSDWWGYKVEVQDAIPEAGAIMHEVGVVVSFNSDSDEMARRMNVEAAKARKYSRLPDGTYTVSEEEALKFVTINPARQLKIESRVGSIEPGKDADLAVWSGPPLSSLSRCERTWIDGREYFSLEMDQAARERDAKERARLLAKVMSDGKAKKAAGAKGEAKGEAPAASDAPAAPAAAPSPPRGLIARMLETSADARRVLYLDMVRQGIDPADARRGECGCEE